MFITNGAFIALDSPPYHYYPYYHHDPTIISTHSLLKPQKYEYSIHSNTIPATFSSSLNTNINNIHTTQQYNQVPYNSFHHQPLSNLNSSYNYHQQQHSISSPHLQSSNTFTTTSPPFFTHINNQHQTHYTSSQSHYSSSQSVETFHTFKVLQEFINDYFETSSKLTDKLKEQIQAFSLSLKASCPEVVEEDQEELPDLYQTQAGNGAEKEEKVTIITFPVTFPTPATYPTSSMVTFSTPTIFTTSLAASLSKTTLVSDLPQNLISEPPYLLSKSPLPNPPNLLSPMLLPVSSSPTLIPGTLKQQSLLSTNSFLQPPDLKRLWQKLTDLQRPPAEPPPPSNPFHHFKFSFSIEKKWKRSKERKKNGRKKKEEKEKEEKRKNVGKKMQSTTTQDSIFLIQSRSTTRLPSYHILSPM